MRPGAVERIVVVEPLTRILKEIKTPVPAKR
jgi:hypothetical protein